MRFNFNLENVIVKSKSEDVNIGGFQFGLETSAEEIRQLMADNEMILEFMKPVIAEAMSMAREDKIEKRMKMGKAIDEAFFRLERVEDKINKLNDR